ncbi:MAG: hypothetical protein Q8Q90_02805 [bacterium]|nr:hypothetical protein [bacterium]
MTTEVRRALKAVSVGMEVVLNGGKEEMNSATIPVQWVFSDETIAKAPKYLLFFEQTQSEASSHQAADYGRRYLCKVSAGVKFIPVFRPGYHRMAVLALAGSEESLDSAIKSLLNRDRTDNYSRSISWTHLEEGLIPSELEYTVVAATVVEFRVPEELFAEKPRTRFRNAVWSWVNLWMDGLPKDECDYRKRKIFAFTLQPIIFFIGATLYASFVFFGSLVAFFFGYKPQNIFKETWLALKLQRPELNILQYNSYRVWEENHHGYTIKQMPVTGVELAIFLLFGLGIWAIDFSVDWWKMLAVASAFVAICLSVIVIWMKRLPVSPEKKKEEEEVLRQRRLERERLAEERYQLWLARNFNLSLKPSEVDLHNLPLPLTMGGRVVQNFKVGFWALKARVCKPYSK